MKVYIQQGHINVYIQKQSVIFLFQDIPVNLYSPSSKTCPHFHTHSPWHFTKSHLVLEQCFEVNILYLSGFLFFWSFICSGG